METNLIITAKEYLKSGLLVTPSARVAGMKSPASFYGGHAVWAESKISNEMIAERWDYEMSDKQDSIGVICGKRSGNLEVIDFDLGGIQFDPWKAKISIELLNKMVIERTQSGGYHVAYRCDKIEGNHPLSRSVKPTDDKVWKKYIETRGEGGFCVIAPSPEYTLLQGDWNNIQIITPEERDLLINSAKSLTEYIEPIIPERKEIIIKKNGENIVNERPGDRFNKEANTETTIALLLNMGWIDVGNNKVCRPGKNTGVSGSVDIDGAFYCFTSSNADFEESCVYSPFCVYAKSEHNGDFSRAAGALAEKYGMSHKKPTASELGFKKVDTLQIDTLKSDVPLEIYEAKGLSQPIIEVNLNNYPQQIRDFVNNISIINPMLPSIIHLVSAYAVIGDIIGKRMICNNMGNPYYPNLWVVCCSETGTNKTGTYAPLNREISNLDRGLLLPSSTMRGLKGLIGKVIGKKAWEKLNQQEQIDVERNLQIDSYRNLNGRMILSDECTSPINSLMGGWDSKNPSKDSPDFLKLTDSSSDNLYATGTDGLTGWIDGCVSFLGFTQNETWEKQFGSEDFKENGMFGRFIPVTSKYIKLTNLGESGSFVNVIGDAREKALTITEKTDCNFGPPKSKDEKDFLGKVIDSIEQSDICGKEFKRIYPDDWKRCRNKILGHAIKMSLIDAFLEMEIIDDTWNKNNDKPKSIDCSKYFAHHAKILTRIFYAYFQQVSEISNVGKLENKIMNLLRKYKEMSVTEIKRKLNFYNDTQFDSLMKGLDNEGMISVKSMKNKHGKPTIVLKYIRDKKD